MTKQPQDKPANTDEWKNPNINDSLLLIVMIVLFLPYLSLETFASKEKRISIFWRLYKEILIKGMSPSSGSFL
jgi:hypothetical protein